MNEGLTVDADNPAQELPRWRPWDFEFQSGLTPENPFQVRLTAKITDPEGRCFQQSGFYDGSGTWKIRVAPSTQGVWSLLTASDDPDLDGKSRSWICIPHDNPRCHGGLGRDPENRHHFLFEDGTRYFLLGYECDWLWALDMPNGGLPTIEPFLDKLAGHGFNHVILNAYAHDTEWQEGRSCEDDYGPPALFAWEGDNASPDHQRFNLRYWHHYDRVIHAMWERGIVSHIMIKVYNKKVKWPGSGSEADDLFFRWLIARYAAYPTVVWDFSKEAYNEKSLDYKISRFQILRKEDPYHRLITSHDDNEYGQAIYGELLDFLSDQQHSDWHATILKQREERAWPVVNVEFGYEHGPLGREDKTYPVAQSPEEVCKRAWEVVMAGGYPVYYYTYAAWDVIRPEDDPPGYTLMGHLRSFFEKTQYWRLAPSDSLVDIGHCLSNPGQEYVVYQPEGKAFCLLMEGGDEFQGEWFHVLSGESWPWDPREGGKAGSHRFMPPSRWAGSPVALHMWTRPS